jgi:hypothetical protein
MGLTRINKAIQANNNGCEFAEIYYLLTLRKPPAGVYHCANLCKENNKLECPFVCCIAEEYKPKDKVKCLIDLLRKNLE